MIPNDIAGRLAACYRRYRPPYPKPFIAKLVTDARIGPNARLLDLACGPGRVALALAPLFGEVTAIDLQTEMIEEGMRGAAELGLNNIDWRVGKAEDFGSPASAYSLVTIGDAFHRLDQERVAENVLQSLVPEGSLAILWSRDTLNDNEPWHRVVRDVVEKWKEGPVWDTAVPNVEEILRRAGFESVASRTFSATHTWTAESILGNLFSTSYCSQRALGDGADAFARELTEALAKFGQVFPETLPFGYTIGQRSDGQRGSPNE
jgi:SAM-dependent methyltransferase